MGGRRNWSAYHAISRKPERIDRFGHGLRFDRQSGMSTSIICDRAFNFSLNILTVTERLSERGFGARHIAFQLVRCGTSIGANAEEAQEGQTKKDFIAKM